MLDSYYSPITDFKARSAEVVPIVTNFAARSSEVVSIVYQNTQNTALFISRPCGDGSGSRAPELASCFSVAVVVRWTQG